MAIKVDFLTGETEKRASSLYQWDYGQTLEIEAPYFPTIVEVHFACRDMREAVVSVCSSTLNVVSVAIPDLCLEHTGEITAWVYGIEGASGRTMYRITIPIISRVRPSRSDAIPEEIEDNYTRLISEVNEAVENLTRGEVIVTKAVESERATTANSAQNASSATYAVTAGTATKAVQDGDGNNIANTYMKKGATVFQDASNFVREVGQTYLFVASITGAWREISSCVSTAVVYVKDSNEIMCSLGSTNHFAGYSVRFVLTIVGNSPKVYVDYGENGGVGPGTWEYTLEFVKL